MSRVQAGWLEGAARRPSPNHDARPAGRPVDLLLLHYTGMKTAEEALDRLCDPAARVSAHYLVGADGSLVQLVAEDRRAWHAGVAAWGGASDINARSIGIELVNPGHDWPEPDGTLRPYAEAQMRCLEGLAAGILARHAILPRRVLGHSDVAPARKKDPGEHFDWARLARAGLGLWPAADFAPSPHVPELAPGLSGPAVIDLQLALAAIGYGIEGTGLYDGATESAVKAFQRHFRARRVDGLADAETQSLVFHLAALP